MEDLHSKYTHRWLTSKAKAYNSSIEGLGVIAIQNISKGENVGVLGGVVISANDIQKYWKIMGHVGIQFDEDFFIVPTSRKELEEKGVFNHSCEPNCGFDGSIKLVAIRDIKEGEELTFDYAFCESLIIQGDHLNDFECNCGSGNCRKFVRPTDWKMPELQNKYRKYFSPYLQKKINN
ncbi:MAG TPA: SET domain-containing protein-lysine N-methyltransferase [Candidatus Nanoarchaeia archaeon]|nr:SET domain-containing protein-lysine N-methyltransferase [Candidatus Nanoarchaeia archaeon]